MAKEAKKDKKTKERLGYIGLGMCIDYFMFRPARKILSIGLAFGGGMLFQIGLERIVGYVKVIIS